MNLHGMNPGDVALLDGIKCTEYPAGFQECGAFVECVALDVENLYASETELNALFQDVGPVPHTSDGAHLLTLAVRTFANALHQRNAQVISGWKWSLVWGDDPRAMLALDQLMESAHGDLKCIDPYHGILHVCGQKKTVVVGWFVAQQCTIDVPEPELAITKTWLKVPTIRITRVSLDPKIAPGPTPHPDGTPLEEM